MDVDSVHQKTTTVTDTVVERSEAQPMEEELESFDIGDLDILGLEQACKKKEYNKISER